MPACYGILLLVAKVVAILIPLPSNNNLILWRDTQEAEEGTLLRC